MDFTIRIANINILIHSIYPGIYNTCKDYLVDDHVKPDFILSTDDQMIFDEFEQIQSSGQQIVRLSAAENLLIHKKVAELLIERDIILMHGAVIAVNDSSFMFSGHSGIGKTTHIKKWLQNLNDSFVVNGDKPFIIIDQQSASACGAPWCGKECLGTNAIVPLRSIVFMERSETNYLEKASFKSIFLELLEQTYLPSDAVLMKKTLALLNKLKDCVSFYKFYFNNYKEDAFRTSFDELTKQE